MRGRVMRVGMRVGMSTSCTVAIEVAEVEFGDPFGCIQALAVVEATAALAAGNLLSH